MTMFLFSYLVRLNLLELICYSYKVSHCFDCVTDKSRQIIHLTQEPTKAQNSLGQMQSINI